MVNNGIILIDYTNILRKRGNRIQRALMTAGVARFRPILITASTTVIAMVPLAMGKSEYVSAIGATFAITVIGGSDSQHSAYTGLYSNLLYRSRECPEVVLFTKLEE